MKRFLCMCLVLALAGCAELGIGPRQVGGALGGGFGAAGGAALGSQLGSGAGRTAATIVGASLGGLFGAAIGQKLTEGDVDRMQRATQETLESEPSGNVVEWQNPDTGRSGTVVAGAATRQADRPCRPFEQTILVDGRTEKATGVACRQANGAWELRPPASD